MAMITQETKPVTSYHHLIEIRVSNPYLTSLPEGSMPYETFAAKFSLGDATTEQVNPITANLSEMMFTDVQEGLKQLLQADKKVVKGLRDFIPRIEQIAPEIAQRIENGGRVFIVGSGSSGRVGVDLAAKIAEAFPERKAHIRGVMAGGDSALIRAREGFEDSDKDGEKALAGYQLTSNDTVFLLSASGSASFNVGCGHFAANQGSNVLYFYNSKNIPSHTKELFSRLNNPVIPLELDIGPQAIAGSTRLQAASLAEVAIGALLGSAFYLDQKNPEASQQYPSELAGNIEKALHSIDLRQIEQLVRAEEKVFSNPNANFRRLRDETDQGCVTFVAAADSIRDACTDAVETSPTFNLSPPRRETEKNPKRAEYRAYLVGKKESKEAWEAFTGREVDSEVQDFVLGSEEKGMNSYANRPKGEENLLIGVAKVKSEKPLIEAISGDLLGHLLQVKATGGRTGLILICEGSLTPDEKAELRKFIDAPVFSENVCFDPLGISPTIAAKIALNMISNATMVLMNKVHGNRMIDVRASNGKLIDRCCREIRGIWNGYHPEAPLELSDRDIYHYVQHIQALQKQYAEERNEYTPSVIKIALAMIALEKTPEDFQEVIDCLKEQKESIAWLGV